jgi:5S rRNA maturation endonuclease (ribonuclease M5)
VRVEAVTTVLRVLGSFNPEPKVNSAGTWGAVSCPLAPWRHKGRDERPSMMVSVEPGRSHCTCMGCGFNNGMLSLAQEVHALGGIDDHTLSEIGYLITMEEARLWARLERDKPDLPESLLSDLDQWHPYWEERGVSQVEVRRWRLGYSSEHQRVLIPFFDFHGNLHGVVGRDITGMRADKYRVFPSGFDRARYLFGEHLISGDEERLFVVEGYLDAIAARRYLDPAIGVVALGTARPSDEQVRRIAMFAGDEVIIGLDRDDAGMFGAAKLERMLKGKVRLSKIEYGTFKDADEAGAALPGIVASRAGGLFDGLVARLTTLVRS